MPLILPVTVCDRRRKRHLGFRKEPLSRRKLKRLLCKYHLDKYMPEYWEGFVFYDVIVIPFIGMDDLVKEMIKAIRGIDIANLSKIPSKEEAFSFLKQVYPSDWSEEEVEALSESGASYLIQWLREL